MEITRVADVSSSKNPHNVDARPIYSHEHAQVIVVTLKPGESLKRHITPVDVFFYVLEGTGVIEIGDEKQQITKDTIVHSPAKIVHCWHNKSNSTLKIMVAKTPKPTTQTILL